MNHVAARRKTCPGSDGPLPGRIFSPFTESFARSLFRFAGKSFDSAWKPTLVAVRLDSASRLEDQMRLQFGKLFVVFTRVS